MPLWRVLSASEPGSGHIARGVGCQDAHAYRLLADGTLLVAVADGAGSASRSAEGAGLAVSHSIEFLESAVSGRLWTGDRQAVEVALRSAASLAREAIGRQCRVAVEAEPETEIGPNDYATTLLLLYLGKDVCAILQIGDGAVVVHTADDKLEVLTKSGHEDYVNETTFLTSQLAIGNSHVRVESNNEIRAATVMTDGMQMLAIEHASNAAFRPFFEPLFRFARQPDIESSALSEFLRSERVCERTDDDKTVVIAVEPWL